MAVISLQKMTNQLGFNVKAVKYGQERERIQRRRDVSARNAGMHRTIYDVRCIIYPSEVWRSAMWILPLMFITFVL